MPRLVFPLLYLGFAGLCFYIPLPFSPSYLGPLVIGAIGFLHMALLFQHDRQARRDELATLRTQIAAMMRNQRRLDDDMQRLRSVLSAPPPDEKISGMMAEVKVLQGLIEQLYQARQERSAVSPAISAAHKSIMTSSSSLDETAILDILKKNLREDAIELALQPIVTLPQRKRVYYECFSRLRTAEGQLLVPEHFLKLAETHQLIGIMDNMLLVRCIQLLRRVQRQEKNLGFFLNLSEHTLRDRRFFEEFLSIMADNVMLAPSLIFELPQRILSLPDTGLGLDLERLARMGYRFSLDRVDNLDINAASLSDLGFRFMKIGAEQLLRFAQQERENPRDIKRMLDLHGIDLIAEHIESERDLVELLDFDIEFGQGYLFGSPRLPRQEKELTKIDANS